MSTEKIIARHRELGHKVVLVGDVVSWQVGNLCPCCSKYNPYGSTLQPHCKRDGEKVTMIPDELYCTHCGVAFNQETGIVTKMPSTTTICPDRFYHHLGSVCSTCDQNG